MRILKSLFYRLISKKRVFVAGQSIAYSNSEVITVVGGMDPSKFESYFMGKYVHVHPLKSLKVHYCHNE